MIRHTKAHEKASICTNEDLREGEAQQLGDFCLSAIGAKLGAICTLPTIRGKAPELLAVGCREAEGLKHMQ
jgi:hypothetical protein